MFISDQPGSDLFAKSIFGPTLRNLFVDGFDIGYTSAENDDLGVEQIDDGGKRSSQAITIAKHRISTIHVTSRRLLGDFMREQVVAGFSTVIALHSWAA